MKSYLTLLSLLLIISLMTPGCGTSAKNEEAIVGQWFSVGWLSDGVETHQKAWFEFNADHTYRAVVERNKEEGKWWVDGYKLFTQASGEERIVVKIEKLDSGNLEIAMNRGGQKELLIFTRAN